MIREADNEYGCMESLGRLVAVVLAAGLVYATLMFACSTTREPRLYTIQEAERLQWACRKAIDALDISAPRCTDVDRTVAACRRASNAIRRVSDSGMNERQRDTLADMVALANSQRALVRRISEAPCL